MPDIGVGFEPFAPKPAVPPAEPPPAPEVKPAAPEPVFEIVRDVAPSPAPQPPRPAEPPAPKPAPEKPAPEKTPPPAPAAVPPVPAAAAPPPAPVPAGPSDQVIRAACFYAPGAEASKDNFFAKLTEVAQKRSKKPFTVQPVLSQAAPLSAKQGAEWAGLAKTAGAEVVFILLPPQLGPEFMEQAVIQLEMSGLHGYLITPAEIESRLLYVDLTVELMLIKRHK